MLLLIIGRSTGFFDLILFRRQILVFGFRLALQFFLLFFLLREFFLPFFVLEVRFSQFDILYVVFEAMCMTAKMYHSRTIPAKRRKGPDFALHRNGRECARHAPAMQNSSWYR